MKKFLSLLLALTLVLSLTVVPARAADSYTIGGTTPTITVNAGDSPVTTVAKGTELTYTLSVEGLTVSKSTDSAGATTVDSSSYSLEYTWTGATQQQSNPKTAKTTPSSATTLNNVSCKIDVKVDNTVVATTTVPAPAVTVVDCTDGVASFTVNGKQYSVSSGSIDVYKVGDAALTKDSFTNIQYRTNYTGNTGEISYTSNNNSGTLSVPVKYNDSLTGTTSISITEKKVDAPTVTVTSPSAAPYYAGRNITFTATSTNAPSGAQYIWTYKKDNGTETTLSTTTQNTLTTNAFTTAGSYIVSCKIKFGTAETSAASASAVAVSADPYVPTRDARDYPYSFTLTRSSAVGSIQTKTLYSPYLQNKDTTSDKITSGFNVTWSSSNQNVATVSGGVVSAGSTTGTATISAVITYNGKTYPAVTYTVNNYVLSADLTRQVYYGNPVTYSYSDLIEAANKALSGSYGYGSYYGTVTTIVSASAPVSLSNLGTFTGSISNNSGYIYATASYSGRGKAPITATVKTSTGQPVTVTLNIPVVPIPRTFDSLTAEPVTTNYTTSINNYRITFPSTYSTYYVVQKNGTTAPDYATVSLGNPYSAGSQYTLSSADFGTNGTCTLYVIATNNYTYGSSYGMYYSGAITVSQTNYNINYNGVAGETVQFKHADFTNFMNEVSQARGDASKTGSYPYVTFNYVTFNYPTSTQGTLYYNGTAMSNSSYSGSFNSRTQITNLDNVTFVPYARTSAKSIPLTFTLSVTKYGANGAVVNRDLKYTGTVAVSIVREDIKYTAAPGDTIRFTDSDFLNYLRTQNGFNSNYYSIDYVTFDQSAVNALNEGVLYAYSTGFNAVKTTDKFYYTTTSYNQNALSDVTFRASAYAKTGTTVYIPFTIYARYGTTGTGTRQVSGTVAIKLAQTMNFVDVKPTDYFYDSVKWAVNSNITKGTSATTFSPYKTCTRAEIVTFLWRAAGSKTPTITRNPFTDVAPSMGMDYYYAILWASQNGIAAGTSATTFSPNATCTRAQIVTFLWRYSNKPAGYYSNPFTDVNKAEHAAYYDAILWAVGKGITKGTTATTFSPYGTCTRGEAVTFLYRAVNGK